MTRHRTGPRSEVRQRTNMIGVRVSDEERTLLQAAAKRQRCSLAALLRDPALAAARARRDVEP